MDKKNRQTIIEMVLHETIRKVERFENALLSDRKKELEELFAKDISDINYLIEEYNKRLSKYMKECPKDSYFVPSCMGQIYTSPKVEFRARLRFGNGYYAGKNPLVEKIMQCKQSSHRYLKQIGMIAYDFYCGMSTPEEFQKNIDDVMNTYEHIIKHEGIKVQEEEDPNC